MTLKTYAALVASLGLMTALAPSETFAGSQAAPGRGFAATHAIPHGFAARSLFRHRGNNPGLLWPAGGGFFYGPNGEPVEGVAQPVSGDVRYTFTQDVPWDWVHRYPPMVAPSDRPYVSSCTAEANTFHGDDGQDQTITVTRCY